MHDVTDRGDQPLGEGVTDGQGAAEDDRADREDNHRDRHEGAGLVRVHGRALGLGGPAGLAVERHEEEARHVERGDARADHRDGAVDPARPQGNVTAEAVGR